MGILEVVSDNLLGSDELARLSLENSNFTFSSNFALSVVVFQMTIVLIHPAHNKTRMVTTSSIVCLILFCTGCYNIRTEFSTTKTKLDSEKFFDIDGKYEQQILENINCILIKQKIPKRGTIRLIEDRLQIFSYMVNILNNIFYYSQELNI